MNGEEVSPFVASSSLELRSPLHEFFDFFFLFAILKYHSWSSFPKSVTFFYLIDFLVQAWCSVETIKHKKKKKSLTRSCTRTIPIARSVCSADHESRYYHDTIASDVEVRKHVICELTSDKRRLQTPILAQNYRVQQFKIKDFVLHTLYGPTRNLSNWHTYEILHDSGLNARYYSLKGWKTNSELATRLGHPKSGRHLFLQVTLCLR